MKRNGRDAATENLKKQNREQKQAATMEQLWLTYFNDTLYEKGVITETERNKMRTKIKNRTASMER